MSTAMGRPGPLLRRSLVGKANGAKMHDQKNKTKHKTKHLVEVKDFARVPRNPVREDKFTSFGEKHFVWDYPPLPRYDGQPQRALRAILA